MENNELFQVIEQLKNTLSDVASARQQVEDVISAYTHTNTEINFYIENFERIEVGISAVIELLSNNKAAIEQQATAIVSEFKKSCTSIVEDIKKELTASVGQFDVEVNRNIVNITMQIKSLETVVDNAAKLASITEIISDSTNKTVDSVNTIKQELNASQKIQNDAIKHIGDTLMSVLYQVQSSSTLLDNITKSLIEQEKQLVVQRQNLDAYSNFAKQAINTLLADTNKIGTLCDNVKTSISHTQLAIDSLKKIVEDNSTRISKENIIDRWLLILCFIILVIIHFV